jgi:hypothetical protein
MKRVLTALFIGVLASTLMIAPSSVAAPKDQAQPTITIPLQGFVYFSAYAKAQHLVIADPAWDHTICVAELTTHDGQNFVLRTQEFFDDGFGNIGSPVYREVVFAGKMTPGGQLKFTWPDTWLEVQNFDTFDLVPTPNPSPIAQLRDHTGYTHVSGRGVNKDTEVFAGSFDGSDFLADCHLTALQTLPGSMGWPFDVVVDGPIEFSVVYHLKVTE